MSFFENPCNVHICTLNKVKNQTEMKKTKINTCVLIIDNENDLEHYMRCETCVKKYKSSPVQMLIQ